MRNALIADLIHQLIGEDRERVLADALTDYHVPGFTSILLHRSPKLNLRLYVCRPGETDLNRSDDPEDNTLWVHSHRFAFECQTLAGWMQNIVLVESDAPSPKLDWGDWWKYGYTSPIGSPDGKMKVHLLNQEPLMVRYIETVLPGQSYHLDSHQLHRIRVPNDQLTVMLLWEHERNNPNPILYSKEALPTHPNIDGLYNQPSWSELSEILFQVMDAI